MLLEALPRAQIRDLLARAGFSAIMRPTVAQLTALLQVIEDDALADGFIAPSVAAADARALLDQFMTNHVAVTKSIEQQLREQGMTDQVAQSASGPYRALAVLLAEFIEEWVAAGVFGDESLFTATVFCEHILAMHGFTVDLVYPEHRLRGAVVIFAERVAGGEDAKREALTNAILGRFRGRARRL